MKVNLKNGGSYRFSNLLYFSFIVRKKYRVDEIAEKMGVHKDSLYRWIRGDKSFPIDQLANLVNATKDIEFLEYFADQCGYAIMPKIKDRKTAEIITQMAKLMFSATGNKDDGE